MKAKVIGNCMVVVAICVGIALPLAAWHNADAQAQARDESLRKQKKAIEELSTANANRRKEIPGRNADSLTNKQLNELLGLRAAARALRRETNYLGRAGAGSGATQIGLEAGRNLYAGGACAASAGTFRRTAGCGPAHCRRTAGGKAPLSRETGNRRSAGFSRFEKLFSHGERKAHAGIIHFWIHSDGRTKTG